MSGPGLGRKVLLLFGLQPARIPPMLVMLGLGAISMRGAPFALPTFATVQFKRFFDCGLAVRCMLPLGAGGFMHLVVLYGYQCADTDAKQLALTEQLFDAALGELQCCRSVAALLAGWGFQRRTHQNPLPGKKDFGWALG